MDLGELGWNTDWESAFAPHRAAGLDPARVVHEDKLAYVVVGPWGDRPAAITGRLRHRFRLDSDLPQVGDWVAVAPVPGENKGLIQAMDLLGRKVLMENGRGLQLLAERMLATAAKADASWGPEAVALRDALQQVGQATQQAWDGAEPAQALANAVPYLQAFGHTVIAWIWLDVAASLEGNDTPAAQGRRAACRYFFRYELPKIGAWLNVVESRDPTCANLPEEAF
jgi:hypothetical protein